MVSKVEAAIRQWWDDGYKVRVTIESSPKGSTLRAAAAQTVSEDGSAAGRPWAADGLSGSARDLSKLLSPESQSGSREGASPAEGQVSCMLSRAVAGECLGQVRPEQATSSQSIAGPLDPAYARLALLRR